MKKLCCIYSPFLSQEMSSSQGIQRLYGTILFDYLFLNKPPSTSVVWENVARLFCCEAPEIFCGLRNLIHHRHEGEKIRFRGLTLFFLSHCTIHKIYFACLSIPLLLLRFSFFYTPLKVLGSNPNIVLSFMVSVLISLFRCD